MSKWNKEELENMLEDVVNELDLSEIAVAKHGQDGTTPAELVKLILEQKDLQIRAMEANFVKANKSNCNIPLVINCTTCAFTDSKYTDETCDKCSREFDKHEHR
jgi:hypothetical protein